MSFVKNIIEQGLALAQSDLVADDTELRFSLDLDSIRPSTPDDVSHVGSTYGDGYEEQFAILSVWRIIPTSVRPGATEYSTRGGDEAELVFSTDRFLLASASELRASRAAPVFTFGQPLVFTAGRRPYTFLYNGHLLVNELDGDGRNQFYEVYDQYLRASSNLVGNSRVQLPWIVELSYKNGFRRGYVTSVDISLDAATSAKADFSFSMFIVQDGFIGFRPERGRAGT